jgi:hypothetical protein
LLGLSAEAVELCADLLRRADELPGSTTAVPLLKRVLGYGLAQQGRPAEAQSALLESLATAREQHALHEIAFTLGALMQLAHEQPDLHVEGVAEESAKLRDQLKMTALPQISVQLGERVQLPEQAATDVVIRAAREPRAPSTDVGVTRR